jgi:cholesterol transport system auxiliary component
MKRLVTIFAVSLLAACGGNVRTAEVVSYDLGKPGGNWSGSRIPIASIDVRAASWLSGNAMHYRLAYAEPQRRQSYVESRWAAPPAELLESFLKRRIVFGQADFTGTGCRLQLVLDEFEQRFDDAQKSGAVLEARVVLSPLRGDAMLSKKTFMIRRPAASADARGGVVAARDAAQALAEEIGKWLGDLSQERPAVVEQCRTT